MKQKTGQEPRWGANSQWPFAPASVQAAERPVRANSSRPFALVLTQTCASRFFCEAGHRVKNYPVDNFSDEPACRVSGQAAPWWGTRRIEIVQRTILAMSRPAGQAAERPHRKKFGEAFPFGANAIPPICHFEWLECNNIGYVPFYFFVY